MYRDVQYTGFVVYNTMFLNRINSFPISLSKNITQHRLLGRHEMAAKEQTDRNGCAYHIRYCPCHENACIGKQLYTNQQRHRENHTLTADRQHKGRNYFSRCLEQYGQKKYDSRKYRGGYLPPQHGNSGGDEGFTLEEKVLLYVRKMQPEHEIRSVNETMQFLHCSRRQLQRVLKKLCEDELLVKTNRGHYRLNE